MNVIKVLIVILLINETYGFAPSMCYKYSRKDFIKLISSSIACNTLLMQKPILNYAQDVENRPLTDEEMEEYNRLLKEAEKIKSIIKANKDALIDNEEENEKEKYLRKQNITIHK